MNRTVTLIGARGGQGTSTVAAALALHTADDLPTTLLTHDPEATARILSAQPPVAARPYIAAPNLTVAGLDTPPGTVTVIDAGTVAANADRLVDDGVCYAVLRGPCYLALATLVSSRHHRFDGVILVAEPGRALSAADASEVLGLRVVATVPVRSRIARLIDAGLLAGRPSEVSGLQQVRDALVYGRELAAAAPGGRATGAGRATIRRGVSHDAGPDWEHAR